MSPSISIIFPCFSKASEEVDLAVHPFDVSRWIESNPDDTLELEDKNLENKL